VSIYKRQKNGSSTVPKGAQEKQKNANAQVDLMGAAAVDPQLLEDEEKDPIAKQVK
jgi:hypothetical protein